MPGKNLNLTNELEIIVSVLREVQIGVSLETVKKLTGLNIELRTLQRRIETLKDQGVVATSGKARSTLYSLADTFESGELQDNHHNTSIDIPLSEKGRKILLQLSRPLNFRQPVGYNKEFLINYRPNTDFYLSMEERRKLAQMGKTNTQNQPAGTYAKEVLQRLLIDLSWNSSRLEGNTYSLLDTQRLLSEGKVADDKTAAEAQMILNHKDAIEFIVEDSEEIDFNYYTITNLHALLSNNLLADPAASGRLRTFGVGITNSIFIPLGMPQLVDEMFRIILSKTTAIKDPFEQAFFIMVHIPYLQPFDDVNKRVSRLAANIGLNKKNLAPLAFVDVPDSLYVRGLLGVYELNQIELFKDVFMWAYHRSALRYAAIRQSLGEPDSFRLQYREHIRSLIYEIITKSMKKHEAVTVIQNSAKSLPQFKRDRFIEIIETELLSLHEGNFARYRVKPSEYSRWRARWNS